MVHVSNLIGCSVAGPTTEEALAATPAAIVGYLGFLASRGEGADPSAPFETEVVEHVMEGGWLGNGAAVIAIDTDPLPPREVEPLLRRHRWIHEALVSSIEELDVMALAVKPAKGRALAEIVAHVLGAEGAYLSSGLRSNPDLNRVAREVERGERDPRDGLLEAAGLFEADVRGATPAERTAVIPHGRSIGSLHRTVRRALEHGWEHLREIEERRA
jgi:predicted RNase H-like HicB family nuclease